MKDKNKIVRDQDLALLVYDTFSLAEYAPYVRTYSTGLKDISKSFFLADSTKIYVSGGSNYGFGKTITPPLPYFYEVQMSYYPNGKLETKGIKLSSGTQIGKWYFGKEDGTYEIVDHDVNMGRFGYYDVLKFLHKKGYINLKTGEGRKNFGMGYHREPQEWSVKATKDGVHWTRYYLDGNSGKILRTKTFVIY